jgi:putative toxin-antitoxin system antitoxin component (TIGR02293 family)
MAGHVKPKGAKSKSTMDMDAFHAAAIQYRLTSVAPSLTRAIEIFGNSQKAISWMNSEHPALGGRSPLAVLDQGNTQAVDDLLTRVEHGIPS